MAKSTLSFECMHGNNQKLWYWQNNR